MTEKIILRAFDITITNRGNYYPHFSTLVMMTEEELKVVMKIIRSLIDLH